MMNGTEIHVDPFTLLQDRSDGSVLSKRHRALSTSALEVEQRLDRGELVIADPKAYPTLRTCLECGCTDEFGCEDGCRWVAELMCSSCLGDVSRSRDAIQADADVAIDLAAHGQINEAIARYFAIQTELLLDIRDVLAAATIGGPSIDDLAEAAARLDPLSGIVTPP